MRRKPIIISLTFTLLIAASLIAADLYLGDYPPVINLR